jgi:pimeloyl-ACP methyl ester carboxylesterase
MKSTRTLSTLLLLVCCFVASATSSNAATAAIGRQIKNIILIHGAWADGSSWSAVIPQLQRQGLHVVAVQLPLTSLKDDAAVIHRAIADAGGPVFLVAHSYGGGPTTEAGADCNVAGIMYVAASAPDVGESFADLVKRYPLAPALHQARVTAAGFFVLSAIGMRDDVAPDLPPSEAAVLAAEQNPLANKAFTDRVDVAAWRSKPTWYVVAGNDRTVPVALERMVAQRMHAKTITIPSSHMVIISHATELTRFISSALKTVAAGSKSASPGCRR